MKFFLLLSAVAVLTTSCTTLSNRRDLYNPSEDAGPYNSLPPARANGPRDNNANGNAPQQGPLQPLPQ